LRFPPSMPPFFCCPRLSLSSLCSNFLFSFSLSSAAFCLESCLSSEWLYFTYPLVSLQHHWWIDWDVLPSFLGDTQKGTRKRLKEVFWVLWDPWMSLLPH
jgi:hypothetical protein